jgi:hypothetical protein
MAVRDEAATEHGYIGSVSSGRFGGRMRGRLIITAVLATLMSGCGQGLVEADAIRKIDNVSDLRLDQVDLAGLSPVSPAKGLKLALQQARTWSDNAELVAILQSAFLVSDEGRMQPLLWTYRFKNASEDAWLGVTIGSAGIEDVVQRAVKGNVLSAWLGFDQDVQDARLDLYEDGFTALMIFDLEAGESLVWFDHTSAWAGSIPAADAMTGNRVDWQPLLQELTTKQGFFDVPLARIGEGDPYDRLMFFPAGSRALSLVW